MLVRIANREDLDQSDSSESVVCAVCQATSVQNVRTFTVVLYYNLPILPSKSVGPLWIRI